MKEIGETMNKIAVLPMLLLICIFNVILAESNNENKINGNADYDSSSNKYIKTRNDPEYTISELHAKTERYMTFKKAGLAMEIVGAPLAVVGLPIAGYNLVKWANSVETDFGSGISADGKAFDIFVSAVIVGGCGLVSLVAGSVLSIIGKKKSKEYQGRLKSIEGQLHYEINGNTLWLVYDF
jgi:hypothetical protein